MKVLAVAPANAPDVKCIKMLDWLSFFFLLCNLSSPKNKVVNAFSFGSRVSRRMAPDDVSSFCDDILISTQLLL